MDEYLKQASEYDFVSGMNKYYELMAKKERLTEQESLLFKALQTLFYRPLNKLAIFPYETVLNKHLPDPYGVFLENPQDTASMNPTICSMKATFFRKLLKEKVQGDKKLIEQIHQELVKYIKRPQNMQLIDEWNDVFSLYDYPAWDGQNTYSKQRQHILRLRMLFQQFGLDGIQKNKPSFQLKKRGMGVNWIVSEETKNEKTEAEKKKDEEYKRILRRLGLDEKLKMNPKPEGVNWWNEYPTDLETVLKKIMFETVIYAYYDENDVNLVGRTGIFVKNRDSYDKYKRIQQSDKSYTTLDVPFMDNTLVATTKQSFNAKKDWNSVEVKKGMWYASATPSWEGVIGSLKTSFLYGNADIKYAIETYGDATRATDEDRSDSQYQKFVKQFRLEYEEMQQSPKDYSTQWNDFLKQLYANPKETIIDKEDVRHPQYVPKQDSSGRPERGWSIQPLGGYRGFTQRFFDCASHNLLCELNGVIPMNVKENIIDVNTRGITLLCGNHKHTYGTTQKRTKKRNKEIEEMYLYMYDQTSWYGLGFDFDDRLLDSSSQKTSLGYSRSFIPLFNESGRFGEDDIGKIGDWLAENGFQKNIFVEIGGLLIPPKIKLDWTPINETFDLHLKAILDDLKEINKLADDLEKNKLALFKQDYRVIRIIESAKKGSDEDKSKTLGKGRWTPNESIRTISNDSFYHWFDRIYLPYGKNGPCSAEDTGHGSGWGGPKNHTNQEIIDVIVDELGKDWWNTMITDEYERVEKGRKNDIKRLQELIKNAPKDMKDDLLS